jgi:hypothetical protein
MTASSVLRTAQIFLACLAFALMSFAQTTTPAAPGKFDGPAELPRIYMKTAMRDTPSPGKTIAVKAGADLQAALDSATCGDILKLEAGATFSGRVKLPKKPCDDAHWIVIRTSAPDESLPPEGTRLTPCFAGIASLPGRPDFHCGTAKNVLAKITFSIKSGNGPIRFEDGANHYRLVGLEVTRDSPGSVGALVSPDGPVAADHIVLDRDWIHGTPNDETTRGLYFSGTTYMAVVDSYLNDFHCAAKGFCSDAQALSGAAGTLPMGPYKIVNNFLEASGENIILGGGPATETPADIEIRRNHLFKPLIWMKGQPDFVGSADGNPFIVKNHFELKNAQRVLFEANVLENSWGGFSQPGFSIVLTPKNQSNGPSKSNLCPLCKVTDVTIRDCTISHVGGAIAIANVAAAGYTATAGERYSIHNLVIDDLDGKKYTGFGIFIELISNEPPLKDVSIDHVTSLKQRVFLSLGIKSKILNFRFTNNLVDFGERGVSSTGGGKENCAVLAGINSIDAVLKECFESSTFTNNVIIGAFGSWPEGNYKPKNLDSVGLERSGARLCQAKQEGCKNASEFLQAGTNKSAIGADLDAITAATKGVP